jgi:Cu(I)/Ag(I) efflux system membrane fusion protein
MLVHGMGAGKPGPDNTETLSDRKLKDDAKDAPAKINVSSDFKKQLTSVLDRYLSLKNSLVESDPEKVKQEAEKLKQAFLKSDLKPLPENDRLQWNTLSDKLLRNVTELIASDGLMNQRLAFQKLSNNLYIAIKTYGLAGKTLYYQFCPMFNNNNGGYWLSETGEIRNPYFGEEMLSCGETRENLDF